MFYKFGNLAIKKAVKPFFEKKSCDFVDKFCEINHETFSEEGGEKLIHHHPLRTSVRRTRQLLTSTFFGL